MARKNIFDMLAENNDMSTEAKRIDKLFRQESVLVDGYKHYTLLKVVDECCFSTWKGRGHCIDVADYLRCLDYENLLLTATHNLDSFLTLIELVFNFWLLAKMLLIANNFKDQGNYNHLRDIMTECLSHYNHKIYIDEEKEQVLVIEDNPAVTAVSEISKSSLAPSIIRYNHHSLKGDVSIKKSILLEMGADLEPKRIQLKAISKDLEDNIFFMLNSMDLRHNNCSKGDKNYKVFVAEMQNSQLEEWYDELYQMMLLAMLELDQQDRYTRVKELKANVAGGNS